MKRITFCANFCNLYAPAKQSDSDAKDPLCLALSIVYQFFRSCFFRKTHDLYNTLLFCVLSSVPDSVKFFS